MKKCPQCGREYDNTMAFCLDDGAELLYGPAKSEPPESAGGQLHEPQTAILHETAAPGEAATRAHIHATEAEGRTSLFGQDSQKSEASRPPTFKLLATLSAALVLLIGGFLAYRYYST